MFGKPPLDVLHSGMIPLVVRFGRLGDMVLQASLLRLLHCRYGRPCRLLTSGHWSSELFAGSVDVDEIWQLRARHTPLVLSPERWRLIRVLRHHDGPVYVSEDSPRQVAKIRRLLALARMPPARCLFISDCPQNHEHWSDRLLHFAALTPQVFSAIDYPAPLSIASSTPHLAIYPADRIDRDGWLQQRGLTGRPLVLLQPGNKRALKWGRQRSDDPKAWPIAHWAALLRAMHGSLPNACLLLCGSPPEAGLLRDIRNLAGVAAIELATHDLPLRRLLAVMEMAHSMVAVDTGPAHMAAAIGCPLVVLYGAESPRVWGRRSPTGSPVIELGGPPEYQSAADIPLRQVVDAWSGTLAMISATEHGTQS
jgi:ADP-heptose:LPS heptosyltransferase